MVLNANVKVRKRVDPSFIEIYEGDEWQVFTRVWMGIVPPHGTEAGYACVVGEVYDDDPRQKPRPKILLDEGQALHPDDWDGEIVEYYEDLFYTEIDGENIAKHTNPTLHDLRMVSVALKDLYQVDMGWTLPAHPPFTQFLRSTEGLCLYDSDIDPETYKQWFPTYRSSDNVLSIMDEPPMGDDQEYGKQLVETLLARNELQVNEHCKLFQNSHLSHPVRAVGLVCAAMQVWDWTFAIRDIEEGDGYEDIIDADMEEEAKAQLNAEDAVRLWQAGINTGLSDEEAQAIENSIFSNVT